MIKKARATLFVEVVTEFDDDYADANDEETVSFLVKQDLQDKGFNVRRCEVLKADHGLILEQLKRVDEAELKYQMEVAQLNELMKKLER